MISNNANQIIYAGNGVAKQFSFTFDILNPSDVHLTRVYADGREEEIVSDYYLNFDKKIVYYPGYAPGAEEPAEDRPRVLAEGEKLVIYRDVPITQEVDMPENHPFNLIENMADKSCIIDQQLKNEIGRSLKVSRIYEGFSGNIPIKAGYGWRVSDDGTHVELQENPKEIYDQTVSTYQQTLGVYNNTVTVKTDTANIQKATQDIYDKALADINEVKSQVQVLAGATEDYSELAHRWADSDTSPDGQVDSKSSKTWAEQTASYLDDAIKLKDYAEALAEQIPQYDNNTVYNAGDVVFIDNGNAYRALVQVQGENPSESFKWAKIQTITNTTFEMDEYGDLMPRVNPTGSTIWDIDENGDITPTAYGSGTEQKPAEDIIIENQRNIGKNKVAIEGLSTRVDALEEQGGGSVPPELVEQVAENTEGLNAQLLQIQRIKDEQNSIAEDVRLLKHFAKGELYTEYVDDSEAHEKVVPKSADEKALLNSIGGKSVVVNQLFNPSKFSSSKTLNNVTFTKDGNKIIVSTTESGASADTNYSLGFSLPINRPARKYYLQGCAIGGSKESYYIGGQYIWTATQNRVDVGKGIVVNDNSDLRYSDSLIIVVKAGTILTTPIEFTPQLIDLTQMFGAGNEPSLEECQAMFTDYIPYTEPTIKHLATNEVVVKGKNLLDEASVKDVSNWELYDYQNTKGRYKLSLDVGKQYVASVNPDSLLNKGYYLYISKYEKGAPPATSVSTTIIVQSTIYRNNPFTVEEGYDYYLWIYAGTGAISCIRNIKNIQLEEGNTPTEYSPYVSPTTYYLPTIEEDGYSAGNIWNERNLTRKKRIKRLAMLALNVDDMVGTSEEYPGWAKVAGLKDIVGANINNNIKGTFELGYSDKIGVNTNGSNASLFFYKGYWGLSAEEWKAKYAGQTFHFILPLGEPIETDIEDNINPLIVDKGGSVEFVNAENSKVPIPSSISYCVSTKEGL